MIDFWESQIDYIIFLNGLLLVTLSAVCFSLNKSGHRALPWKILMFFGMALGVKEWIDLLLFSLGGGTQFGALRIVFLMAAFLLLGEFGRSGIKSHTGRGPERWIFIPLLALALAGRLDGLDGFDVSLRYALGLTGGALTSAALFISAAGRERVLGRKLKAAGLGMAGYAMVAAVGPQAGFFPASFINEQSFIEVTGFPVDLAQAVFVLLAAMALWSYLLSYRRIKLDLPERYLGRQYVFLIVINVTLILGLGLWAACYWGGRSMDELRQQSKNNVNYLSMLINGELIDTKGSMASLSSSPGIALALTSPTVENVAGATFILDRYKNSMDASACLLLDRDGKIVASSGGVADVLQKNNHSLPALQKESLSGRDGWYFEPAESLTKSYYYYAFPVKDSRGEVIGTSVAQKSTASIEMYIAQYPYCFLVNPQGYIYLLGGKDSLPKDTGAAIKKSYTKYKGAYYIVDHRDLAGGGWTVALLTSTGQIWTDRLFCICITLALCVLIILFYTALMSARVSAGRISLSERRYYSLVEGSPNWIKMFDREGRFVSINRSGLLAMGWREEDIIGKKFDDIWPEKARPVVEKAMESVLQGERCSFEAGCERPDGVTLTWSVTLYPIYEEDGGYSHFVGISTNVTERRKAEEALRESEGKFRTLFDSASDAIFIMDGTVFIDCNPMALKMFGCTHSQILGRDLLYFSPERQPDGTYSREKAKSLIDAVLDGEAKYLQWRLIRQDGTVFDVEISLSRIKLKDVYYIQATLRDITSRKKREEQLRLQAAALQSAANAIVITDLEGSITWINPAFTSLTGYTPDEAIGRKMSILKSGNHNEVFYRELWDTIFSGLVWHGETQNRHKNGGLYTEEQTITPVRDEEGRITHFVSIKQDVTERKHQEQQLNYLATHDPLTSLPNRRVLEDSLSRAVIRASRGVYSTLLFMDLDNFKLVNDTLGHSAGDQVLYMLTRLLQGMLRGGDLLVRFGGDEFAVLLEGVMGDEALAIAERMRRMVEEYRFVVDGQDFHLTLSIGMVSVDGLYSPGVVLSQADTAMYMAKEQGKNRVLRYRHEDGMLDRLNEDSLWASRVKTALAEDRFVLHYQPLMRTSDDLVNHYEALVRMVGEGGEIIAPGDFIPVTERYGLMPQLDRWVFKNVIKTLKNSPDTKIFMNISGSSLADESFTAYIEEYLNRSGIDPRRLGFEITETAVVQDMAAAERWVRRIKSLGCSFALDDFGAGFNSFIYLHNLSVDQIKIDGYYIRSIESDPTRCALVKAMHALARTMGMETVAEFVENEATLRIVKEIGITYGQGYHIDMPCPNLPGAESMEDKVSGRENEDA